MLWRSVLLGVLLCGSPASVARQVATTQPAHYVVFELDASGQPQPMFHADVSLGLAAGPSDAPAALATLATSGRRHEAGAPLQMQQLDAQGEKFGQPHTLWLPARVRGEFARDPDGGDDRIDLIDVPAVARAFVVRLPQIPGGQVEFEVAGQRTRFALDTLAARAPMLPLASLASTQAKASALGPAANRLDILILGDGYTQGEQSAFESHAQALERSLLLLSPHREYAGFLQFSRAFVASAQSGADHPPFQANCSSNACCADSAAQNDPRAGQFADTAFDARFCTGQSHRLLTVNTAKALATAAAWPDWDVLFVTVNDPVYGGSGGQVAVASAHVQAPKLVVHEFGHTFSGLADEYETEYPGFPACSDRGLVLARCEANATDVNLFAQVKWRDLPGTGLFEGARYKARGMFRPVDQCLMRALNAPFCPVCSQEYVLTLYRGGFGVPAGGISLIEPDSESPPTTSPIHYVPGTTQQFRVDLLRPSEATELDVRWFLDGVAVATDSPSFSFSQAESVPATRLLELRVTDPAALVFSAAGKPLLTHTRRWTVQVDSAPTVLVPDSGWYWNPTEGGRGYFLERRPGGSVFMAGFLYASDGRPTWFTAQGSTADGETRFAAPMNVFGGGQTLTGPYRPPTAGTDLGALSLEFGTNRSARLQMPQTDIALERFPFAPGSVLSPPQDGAPQSGWWWHPAEGGRGYALEFQGDQLFLIAFMYDDAGAPVWYLANGTMRTPTRFEGRWLRFADGQALGQAARAPRQLEPDAGALTLDFNASDRGILTLPNGRTLSIERFPF